MAATTKILRDLIHYSPVKKPIVDRKTEMPILKSNEINMAENPSLEKVHQFMVAFFDEMRPEADQVYSNIFVGNYKSIMNVDYLKSKGITHVLNVGEHDPVKVLPKINPDTFKEVGISYHTKLISDYVKGSDLMTQGEAFLEAADMIDVIMAQPDAKLVVNCMAGMSRSASVVITYLMVKKKLTAAEAIVLLKQNRDVWPSNINLKVIAHINNQIHGFDNVQDDEDFGDISLRTLVNADK